MADSFTEANSLEFTGSPSWMLNNKLPMRTRLGADEIKNAYCAKNEGLAGCENELSKAPAPRKGRPGAGSGARGGGPAPAAPKLKKLAVPAKKAEAKPAAKPEAK